MAGVIELAPWTSMSAGASNDITQPLREWADALSYADGVFWIDVKSKSGAPTLHIQTAAVAEGGYFQDGSRSSMSDLALQFIEIGRDESCILVVYSGCQESPKTTRSSP